MAGAATAAGASRRGWGGADGGGGRGRDSSAGGACGGGRRRRSGGGHRQFAQAWFEEAAAVQHRRAQAGGQLQLCGIGELREQLPDARAQRFGERGIGSQHRQAPDGLSQRELGREVAAQGVAQRLQLRRLGQHLFDAHALRRQRAQQQVRARGQQCRAAHLHALPADLDFQLPASGRCRQRAGGDHQRLERFDRPRRRCDARRRRGQAELGLQCARQHAARGHVHARCQRGEGFTYNRAVRCDYSGGARRKLSP
ncbi:MAG: hypothetical protein IPF57_10210 [Gammaproteobacteria bacterium]|nr:hypothetical protein [Gammaproteobacteria bacterium]